MSIHPEPEAETHGKQADENKNHALLLLYDEVAAHVLHHDGVLDDGFEHDFDYLSGQIAWCEAHALRHGPIDESRAVSYL